MSPNRTHLATCLLTPLWLILASCSSNSPDDSVDGAQPAANALADAPAWRAQDTVANQDDVQVEPGDASDAKDQHGLPAHDAIGVDEASAPEPCQRDLDCAASKLNDPTHCAVAGCAEGVCIIIVASAGSACDDNKACTSSDACNSTGQCIGQLDCPLVSGSSPACTLVTCSAAGACQHTSKLADCDDGNVCTVSDTCAFKQCSGTPLGQDACDDGQACTEDGCDPSAGCTHAVSVGVACFAKNACVANATCQANGKCVGVTVVCPAPAQPCVVATCSPVSGCQLAPSAVPAGVACDDGNACTSADLCDGTLGGCVGSKAVLCKDGNPCTEEVCLPAIGCTFTANTWPCDADKDACTGPDACLAKVCVAGPQLKCDDGNACTDDACDPASGCAHLTNSAPCEDGSVCTKGDLCVNSKCVPGVASLCDDGEPCTTDACHAVKGCAHVPYDCEDNNPCTKPLQPCKVAGGCLYQLLDGPNCVDNNQCTLWEACVSGQCLGKGLDCNDDDDCTDDTCEAAKGCLNKAKACDDGNDCTFQTCKKGKGCAFAPIDGFQPCSSDVACGDKGVCKMDVCAFDAPQCDDLNECTVDGCTLGKGCSHTPAADGGACAGGARQVRQWAVCLIRGGALGEHRTCGIIA